MAFLIHVNPRRMRPDYIGDPVVVYVNLEIKWGISDRLFTISVTMSWEKGVAITIISRSMGPVDDSKEAYSLDAYFRQSWTDKRLRSDNFYPFQLQIKLIHRSQMFANINIAYTFKIFLFHYFQLQTYRRNDHSGTQLGFPS